MSRQPNQKLKIMHLRDILEKNTDEDHPLSLAQIADKLAARGITCERKSLYDDIEALRLFGLDIETMRDRTTRYYIASRKFQLPELLLMADSVQSSRFITESKTNDLIAKLCTLAPQSYAEHFTRRFHVVNRIKNMNESIYYNVDNIHSGIAAGRQIEFLYYEYDMKKAQRLRRDGARYRVSPFALKWDDENYYLIAYDPTHGKLVHFRVDRMKSIEVTELPREGGALYDKADPDRYDRRTFSMFTGEETPVTLEFDQSLAGTVLDRFGKETLFIPQDANRFHISVSVAVSPPFYGWIFAFGEKARIVSPQKVIDGFKEHAARALAAYEG